MELRFPNQSLPKSRVDFNTGEIKGVSLITEGHVIGHDCFSDSVTNKSVLNSCNKLGTVKVKFNHGTDVGSIVGLLRNFRIEGNQVKADLELLKSSEHYNHILEMADKLGSHIGLSIAFKPDFENLNGKKFVRCSEIYSADLVDAPAANPNGLFERKEEKVNTFGSTKYTHTETSPVVINWEKPQVYIF